MRCMHAHYSQTPSSGRGSAPPPQAPPPCITASSRNTAPPLPLLPVTTSLAHGRHRYPVPEHAHQLTPAHLTPMYQVSGVDASVRFKAPPPENMLWQCSSSHAHGTLHGPLTRRSTPPSAAAIQTPPACCCVEPAQYCLYSPRPPYTTLRFLPKRPLLTQCCCTPRPEPLPALAGNTRNKQTPGREAGLPHSSTQSK